MANKKLWLGMLVITLVFGMAIIGCKSSSELPISTVYRGEDVQGNSYVLRITEGGSRAVKSGDNYVLTITYKNGTLKTSEGTVEKINDDGTFVLQPSVAGSNTFSIVINNNQVSSITGEIALTGGDIIILPTFSTIHLRANSWQDGNNPGHYGADWTSGLVINLLDFVDSIKGNGRYQITVSGIANTAIDYTLFQVFRQIADRKIYNSSSWSEVNKWIGSSDHYEGEAGMKAIPRGQFSQIYIVQFEADGELNNQGEYLVMMEFLSRRLLVNPELGFNFNGGGIPDHIPFGNIMAWIDNFSISIKEVD